MEYLPETIICTVKCNKMQRTTSVCIVTVSARKYFFSLQCFLSATNEYRDQ